MGNNVSITSADLMSLWACIREYSQVSRQNASNVSWVSRYDLWSRIQARS